MQKRIIKFRHFSEDFNKLVDVDYIDLLRNGFGIQYGQNSEAVRWEYPDELQLQQFTGLYDKNGKEIYEGDIIKDESMFDENQTIVEWNRNGFGWYPFDYWGGGELEVTVCVVIGNIHQPPE